MMTEQELKERLAELRQKLGFLGSYIGQELNDQGELVRRQMTQEQLEVAQGFLRLLESLNWQIALNSYKYIKAEQSPALKTDSISLGGHKCGQLVIVRSARNGLDKKSHLGFLIGDVPLGIHVSVQGDTLNVSYGHTNPAIFVPALGTILYGYESWWSPIEMPEQLAEITDETIQQQWYVQLLQNMAVAGGEDDTE